MSNKLGVYLGRFSPFHVGHDVVVDTMVIDFDFKYEDVLLIIGSSTTQGSMRHMFDYSERRRWIKRVYPDLNIVGLADFPSSNDIWFQMLVDIINLKGRRIEDCVFYTGCMEDV